MAETDQRLRGKGYPKNVKRKDVSDKIAEMNRYLQEHRAAAILIASGEQQNPPSKPQKSNGDMVSKLLKYIDYVLDNVRNLEAHRNPYMIKYIRTMLDVAYHETKKCVEKIRAERPEIKDVPADSTDPKEYLRNAHTWCVGQLYWEDGQRIGAATTAEDLAGKKPAETEQKPRSLLKNIIGWIFKKTSHFICALIVTVAAAIIAAVVVDILADFGLLERIKAFFTE